MRLLKLVLFFLLVPVTIFVWSSSLKAIPKDTARKIGNKIWHNECRGSLEGLTSWNLRENFASMGIGHFLWYLKNKEERFQELFPTLLLYLKSQGVILPKWLKFPYECPWNTREEFYAHMQSAKMQDLRQLLYATRDLQAAFIAKRLEDMLPLILGNCSLEEKKYVSANFHALASNEDGLYALIDYLNFKGAGLSSKEAYKGKGWGLQQVLLRMKPYSTSPLKDFIQAAKDILTERVNNAPPERQEACWLGGWLNRLNTYLPKDTAGQ